MSSSTFTFSAVDLAGQPQTGEVHGDSKQAVTDELRQRGLVVTDLTEKKKPVNLKLPFGNKVKAHELTVLTRQLATMISSGMTLLRAFYVLQDQLENKFLRETISTVREDIEAGITFSDSLARHPKVFSDLYVAMVRAGEAGGVLEEALERTASQLEKDDQLRRQVKAAMVYPSAVLSFAAVVLIALVVFIVPVFAQVFKDFGGELPMITKFTLGLSTAFTDYWFLLMLGAVGIYLGSRWLRKSKAGKPYWDRFRLNIPFKIGQTVQKIALARWSRTFSALYSAGVPIMQTIEVTGRTAGNVLIERAMADVIASVKSGGTIAAPLRESSLFPAMVAHMIAVGEESGNLDGMLAKVADFYEDEVSAAIKALTSLIEPIMIMLVGGIVGFIVIAMYMPMFKVYDTIK